MISFPLEDMSVSHSSQGEDGDLTQSSPDEGVSSAEIDLDLTSTPVTGTRGT